MGMIPVLSFIRFKIYTAAPIHKQITRDVLRYMQPYFHLLFTNVIRRRALYVKSTSAHAWGHDKCPTFIGLTSFIPGLSTTGPPSGPSAYCDTICNIDLSLCTQSADPNLIWCTACILLHWCRLVLAFGASTCFTYDL